MPGGPGGPGGSATDAADVRAIAELVASPRLAQIAARLLRCKAGTGEGKRKGKGARSQRDMTGMVGTPNYMAPELMSSANVTPAVDIFSLGIMLFQISSVFVNLPKQGTPWRNLRNNKNR